MLAILSTFPIQLCVLTAATIYKAKLIPNRYSKFHLPVYYQNSIQDILLWKCVLKDLSTSNITHALEQSECLFKNKFHFYVVSYFICYAIDLI